MLNNKKMMLIGLIIGFGSGLFISGIVISILFYTSSKVEIKELPAEKINGIYHIPEAMNQEIKNEKIIIEDPIQEQPIAIEPEIKDSMINDNDIQKENELIEVIIPQSFGASQIAKLLMEKGVVPDANILREYIQSKNKAKRLIHGIKQFPYNADLQTILRILTTS